MEVAMAAAVMAGVMGVEVRVAAEKVELVEVVTVEVVRAEVRAEGTEEVVMAAVAVMEDT